MFAPIFAPIRIALEGTVIPLYVLLPYRISASYLNFGCFGIWP